MAALNISSIKVSDHPDGEGHRRFLLEWHDAAGDPSHAEYFGLRAQRTSTELQAATVIGESERMAYLIGLIRGVTNEREERRA